MTMAVPVVMAVMMTMVVMATILVELGVRSAATNGDAANPQGNRGDHALKKRSHCRRPSLPKRLATLAEKKNHPLAADDGKHFSIIGLWPDIDKRSLYSI